MLEYLEEVCNEFGVDKEAPLSMSKKRVSSEPRQVFFLVCEKKDIPISYIQKCLEEQTGSSPLHSIIYGRNKAKVLCKEDPYLSSFVEGI
jgi:hypothetical protein